MEWCINCRAKILPTTRILTIRTTGSSANIRDGSRVFSCSTMGQNAGRLEVQAQVSNGTGGSFARRGGEADHAEAIFMLDDSMAIFTALGVRPLR